MNFVRSIFNKIIYHSPCVGISPPRGSDWVVFTMGVFLKNVMAVGSNIAVYMIFSIKNPERFYIGSTKDFKDRMNSHLWFLRKNKHHSGRLQNHYNKYGQDDLVFVVLKEYEIFSKSELLLDEQRYLDYLNPFFNLCRIAGSRAGIKISAEHIQALVNSNKGRPVTQETRDKISRANKGRDFGELHRIRTGVASLGRKKSDASKKKQSLKMLANPSHPIGVVAIGPNDTLKFKAIAEAARFCLLTPAAIRWRCMRAHKHREYGGYYWLFLKDYLNIET